MCLSVHSWIIDFVVNLLCQHLQVLGNLILFSGNVTVRHAQVSTQGTLAREHVRHLADSHLMFCLFILGDCCFAFGGVTFFCNGKSFVAITPFGL